MRRRVWRRAKKITAVIKWKTKTLLLLGREGSCGWEYLPEEGEGEVDLEERAICRSRPGQRLHGPVAAALALSDLRPILSSTMNLITHVPLSLFALRFTTLVRVISSNRLSEASASNKKQQYRTLYHVCSPTWPMSIRSTTGTGSTSSLSYRSPILALFGFSSRPRRRSLYSTTAPTPDGNLQACSQTTQQR